MTNFDSKQGYGLVMHQGDIYLNGRVVYNFQAVLKKIYFEASIHRAVH